MPCVGAATSSRRHGKNIYVSTTGNDSTGTGAIGFPYLTIGHAESVMNNGDNIVVRGGTYTISALLTISNSGTLPLRRTIMAYSGEAPVLNGPGSYTTTVGFQVTGNYRVFVGIAIQNLAYIYCYDCHHVIFNRCISQNQTSSGCEFDGSDSVGSSHDNQILYCQFITNSQRFANGTQNAGSGWAQGATFAASDNGIAIGNMFNNNWGEGLSCINSIGCLFRGNTLWDSWSTNIYNDSSQNTTITENFTYSTGVARENGGPVGGIEASQEITTRSGVVMSGLTITNNICVGTQAGFEYFIMTAAHPVTNSVISNNTFVNCPGGSIVIQLDTGVTGNIVQNNIFYHSAAGTNQSGTVTGYSCDHNCWYNGTSGTFSGTGDITGNPNLVSPSTLTAVSQKPSAGSPVLGAGTTLAGITEDYARVARTAPYSIGAYQTS